LPSSVQSLQQTTHLFGRGRTTHYFFLIALKLDTIVPHIDLVRSTKLIFPPKDKAASKKTVDAPPPWAALTVFLFLNVFDLWAGLGHDAPHD
jgi:hypothetical protein